jgi:hypothetical protein
VTIPDGQINLPEVLAELQDLYPRYEQALVTKGLDCLSSRFASSPSPEAKSRPKTGFPDLPIPAHTGHTLGNIRR